MQVIIGRAPNTDAVLARSGDWLANLAPGAHGWLGSTIGATGDGRVVIGVRFASEADARANSERPEQGAWWAETAKLFDGEPAFFEGTDIDLVGLGTDDQAGFVQVMRGRGDPATLRGIDDEFAAVMERVHPALTALSRVWTGPDEYVEFVYFTDEAGARAGEQAMGQAPELAELLPRFEQLMADVEFFDLRDPVLESP